ncbi:hypothetical protein [Pseudoxanthomonas dokdonensis]|uniref:hypothetical protein n=1 Tax=Pseudoxanthomonas dokdonensis TaxID=344882 RepID=UPI0012ED9FC2|nr:hypothetical protein [Pseudoxanthomonas dokdonensis]
MQSSRQRSEHQTRERRRLALEAARLMAESGLRDYQQAKSKAAQRLHIHDEALLPSNSEIEQALREHQRLFAGAGQQAALLQRRQAALPAMQFFERFSPRLAGAVADGTADDHSPVKLHLHSDDADAVQRLLLEQGIPAELRSQQLRMDRVRDATVDVWSFNADGVDFELLVLPYDALRQAPLSAVDGKPMRRLSSSQLKQLLTSQPPA